MKINDLNVYPIGPTPTTPPAGGVFTDPTFLTTILRVTDAADGSGFVNEYSAIFDAFNCDSSRIYYYSLDNGGRWVAELDIKARKVTNKHALSQGGISAVYWSRLNPDTLYAIQSWQAANIWAYDAKKDIWTLVVDLTKLVPAIVQAPNAAWIGSRGMSWDDNRFHIDFGAAIGVGIYDAKKNAVIGPITLATAQAALPGLTAYAWDKSTMDGSGVYICTVQNGAPATLNGHVSNSAELLCNIETGTFFPLMFGPPEYGPAGYYPENHQDFAGGGLVAGSMGLPPPGSNDGFYPAMIGPVDPKNLATYLTRRRIGPRTPWGTGVHCSFRDKSLEWVTFAYDGVDDVSQQPFHAGEVFQLSATSPPDGSVNRRICQTYSNPAAVGQSYWAVPFSSQAQDNRCVIFHSTYSNARLDIYIAFLDDSETMVMLTSDESAAIKSIAAKL